MENIRIISLYLLCSGGIHGNSSASNTMENTRKSLYLQCSGGIHGNSSASNVMKNILLIIKCVYMFTQICVYIYIYVHSYIHIMETIYIYIYIYAFERSTFVDWTETH